MFGSGCENCPEFGVLGGVIFKFDILLTGRKITVLRGRFRLHLPHITELCIRKNLNSMNQ